MPRFDARALLRNTQLIEKLASAEHERWSHWQRYLHDQCTPRTDGSLLIPAGLARHWTTQLNTPYSQLSEKEKNSDRDQVRRYLPIILAELEASLPAVDDGT